MGGKKLTVTPPAANVPEQNFAKHEGGKKRKSLGKTRRNSENEKNGDDKQVNQLKIEDERDGMKKNKLQRKNKRKDDKIIEAEIINDKLSYELKNDETDGMKKNKLSRKKKRKNDKIIEAEIVTDNKPSYGSEGGFDKQNSAQVGVKIKSKSRKKKRNYEEIKKAEITEVEDASNLQNDEDKVEAVNSAIQGHIGNSEGGLEADTERNINTRKSKKARKMKKKDHVLSRNDEGSLGNSGEAEEDEVYEISSGDEDCSQGMNKWVVEFRESRPGIKILQQRIDDFITAHELQEEQARKEREDRAAEGGWTVVVHHKGRKKTTDAESGIVVGSVAQAAVMDKMSKKKNKDVGSDFYRFQKREAKRNEIMMLQSKFEQDKKRIQQLRAERKFRPY